MKGIGAHQHSNHGLKTKKGRTHAYYIDCEPVAESLFHIFLLHALAVHIRPFQRICKGHQLAREACVAVGPECGEVGGYDREQDEVQRDPWPILQPMCTPSACSSFHHLSPELCLHSVLNETLVLLCSSLDAEHGTTQGRSHKYYLFDESSC